MPNIDQLSIEIEANADKATKAIANLTSHLNGLSLALNRINTNSISKFAKSVESLSRTGKMVNDTTRTLEHMADTIADKFGVKSKTGLTAIRDGLDDLAKASKNFRENPTDKLWESVSNAQNGIVEAIRTYSSFKNKVEDTSKSLREFINVSAKSGTKISLVNVAKDLGEELSHFQKVLGKNFTSTLDSTTQGVKDLEEWLGELDKEFGTGYSNMALDTAIRELVSTLENAKTNSIGFEESLYHQKQAESDAKIMVKDYTDALLELTKIENGVQSSGISELINSLRGLNDIIIPDFSPFADAINALNRASTDKIVKNINAVKQALNDTIPDSENLKKSLDDMGRGSVSTIANEFQERMLPAVRDIDILIDKMFNSFVKSMSGVSNFSSVVADVSNGFRNTELAISGCVEKAMEFIKILGFMKSMSSTPLLEDFREYKPDVVDVTDNFKEWDAVLDGTYKKIGDVKDKGLNFDGAEKAVNAVSGKLVFLGEMVEKVSEKLGHLGDLGIKGLKIIYTPLKNLAEEYKEKAEKIADTFKKMRTAVEKQLTKMAAFWKRIMRTFTFMLVRKAITAMIKDIKESIDELALFEKHLGKLSNGQFNKSLSEIQADFHYIGRAIVAAFEPLINFVVPALNAVASAIAHVLSLVGEFFAAFTGQNYFVTARRTVVDYGDSIDDNNKKLKEQKKLLLGIDELNVLPSKNDSSNDKDSGVNFKDAFDEKPVSDKMKGIANRVKEILGKIFDPLKKAWDRNGEYVKKAFKYMMTEISKLCASVGRDFLEVWNGPVMAKVFDHILISIGNIMNGIGNLARQFRLAWDAGGKGKIIFENIAKILETITGWVEKTTKYFMDWAGRINFNPLLSALGELLGKLNKVANFLGGVFYDIVTNVVLKYIQWMIEEGLPHLMHTLDEVITHFDFDKIRGDLQILEVAFEHMAEEIDKGITNAIGNVGKQLGDWMSSEAFTEFCETLEYFMSLVTAERVEKLFTALGTALLNVGKTLADFISSDAFKAFIDKLVEWYDSKSAEDIAGYLENIARAIIGFKFVAFVGPGVAGFLKVLAALMTMRNIRTIATGLSSLGTGASAAGAGIAAGGTTAATGIGALAGAAAALTGEVFVIAGELSKLGEAWGTYNKAAQSHTHEIGQALTDLNKLYKEKGPEVAAEWAKTVYNIDIAGDDLTTAQSKLVSEIDTLWADAPQSLYDGWVQGIEYYFGKDGAGLTQYFKDIFTNVVDGVKNVLGIASPSKVFDDIGSNTALGFKDGYDSGWSTFAADALLLIGTFISDFKEKFTDIGSGIGEKFGTLKENISTALGEAKESAVIKAGEIKDNVTRNFEALKTNAKNKFDAFKTNVKNNFDEALKNASTKAKDIAKKVSDGIRDIPKNTKDKFNTVKDNIKDKLDESILKVSDRLGKMKQKFEKFKLDSVAKNIIRGFTSGLKSAWTDVITWANQAVAKLKSKFQSALQIKSPSKVFEKYGKYTVEGFNKGISNFQYTTSQAVDNWVASFSDMQVVLTPETTSVTGTSSIVSDVDSSSDVGLTSMELRDILYEFGNRYLGNGETRIVLEMDGRRLYEQVVREDRSQVMRTGKSSFAY